MPNYTVIHDRAALQAFIAWLPATLPGETFYVALLARSKYVRDLGIGTFNSDRHQCKRFLCTADRLMEKIAQLEIAEVGDLQLVKTVSWYDNEYGFVTQLIRVLDKFAK